MPVIAIDLHEMASDSTYYFTPEADPYDPFLPADLKKTLEVIGRNNAKRSITSVSTYFTRDARQLVSRLWRELADVLRRRGCDI